MDNCSVGCHVAGGQCFFASAIFGCSARHPWKGARSCQTGDLAAAAMTERRQNGRIEKSDAEWRKLLTDEQFQVTRPAGNRATLLGSLLEHEVRPGVFNAFVAASLCLIRRPSSNRAQAGRAFGNQLMKKISPVT